MELTNMTQKQRLELMRQRHSFFSEMLKGYSHLEIVSRAFDKQLAVIGIELQLHPDHISLYIPLGCNEYETYHIIKNKENKLVVSPYIYWQNDCANDILNIFTGKHAKEEDIFTC